MPAFNVELSITGLQEAQEANAKDIAALQPKGAMGKAVRHGMMLAQRYAQYLTHVDTGAWRASHRMQYSEEAGDPRGSIYVDPSATNPRHPTPPEEYATIWELREGEMAVYKRTQDERGQKIADEMRKVLFAGMAD